MDERTATQQLAAFLTGEPTNGLDPQQWPQGELRMAARRIAQGESLKDQILPDLSLALRGAIFEKDPDGDAGPTLHTISARELLTREWPEPDWIIPGILPVGLTILGGKPKTGKSWLCLQIAQAVATGGKVFGRDVLQGRVLYAALEDNPRRIAKRMKDQRWPLDNVGEAEFLHLSEFMRDIGDLATGAAKLADYMRARKVRMAVIDTMSRAIMGDPDKARDMIPALSPIQAAAMELEASVIGVDHHHKATGADPDPVLDIGGSIAKGGVGDTIWGLYKTQGKVGAKLHLLGREVDEQELSLKFDPLTMCWQTQETNRLNETQQKIVNYLRDVGVPAGIVEIEPAAEQNKGTVHRELTKLVAAGEIVRRENGRSVLYELVEV